MRRVRETMCIRMNEIRCECRGSGCARGRDSGCVRE